MRVWMKGKKGKGKRDVSVSVSHRQWRNGVRSVSAKSYCLSFCLPRGIQSEKCFVFWSSENTTVEVITVTQPNGRTSRREALDESGFSDIDQHLCRTIVIDIAPHLPT